ncbi:MAG: MerC domain-containing protein [Deltaproteobacteria bacterium]|nr:MerC domain-containing protein [Deltaproteobacteria bacterium]
MTILIRSFLERLGMAGSFLLGAFCPLCIPAIGAFLASLGFTFLVNVTVLKGLMFAFLFLALSGLAFSYIKEHRSKGPLALGILGAFSIYAGRYLFYFIPFVYFGALAFVGASLWNLKLRRRRSADSLPSCCVTKQKAEEILLKGGTS